MGLLRALSLTGTHKKPGAFSPVVLATTAVLALAAVGCADDTSRQSLEGQTLRTIEIPENFDFATTRSVALTFEGETKDIGVRVRLPDGSVLYQGMVPLREVKLAVPTMHKELVVERLGKTKGTIRLPLSGPNVNVSL